jgi:hypothetical protein
MKARASRKARRSSAIPQHPPRHPHAAHLRPQQVIAMAPPGQGIPHRAGDTQECGHKDEQERGEDAAQSDIPLVREEARTQVFT